MSSACGVTGGRQSIRARFLHGGWGETSALVLAGATLILIMTQPAFRSFFLGEDFVYLGQYRAHGNDYWAGVLSPLSGIFFRPALGAANLLWQFVLPLDPWFHHVRNFVFSALNLLLLSRILMYLVASRAARVVALLFFAVSKIHLTTIGYIIIYDSILTLTLLLATILCMLRYMATRRPFDYVVGMLFCFLSLFTRDYGLVVVGVIGALVACRGMSGRSWRTEGAWWARRLAPLLAMVVFYLALRYSIAGPLPRSNPTYAPRLTADVAASKLLIFTSTLGNLALTELVDPGTTGGNGLGLWLVTAVPGLRLAAGWGDAALCAMFATLLAVTLVLGRRRGWPLLFPFVWMVAYLGPTLLTRNVQMYYMYESLAGAAVLLGQCLEGAGRRLLALWAVALAVVAVNGTISNYTSVYHWQFAANRAQRIQRPVLDAYRGKPIESITFVSESVPFWEWTLAAGPMVPELLRRPALTVRVVHHNDPAVGEREPNPRNLFFDADDDFAPVDASRKRLPAVLVAISPARTRVGTGFNVQPNGLSALGITAANATSQTVVMMGERPLATTFGTPRFLSAVVPGEVLARAGRYPVYLRNGLGDSNRLEFVVGLEDPPLVLRRLSVSHTGAGQGFNIQPDGRSALSIDCENAVPGTVVMFGDTPLVTAFGHERWLTAIVPAELYRRPGRYRVYLKNGAIESNRLEFVVGPSG